MVVEDQSVAGRPEEESGELDVCVPVEWWVAGTRPISVGKNVPLQTPGPQPR